MANLDPILIDPNFDIVHDNEYFGSGRCGSQMMDLLC
jgi:hypothetical protein